MRNLLNFETLDEATLIDLLVEYSERCTQSVRGAGLGEQEYKDYKEAIDNIATEIRRRKMMSGVSGDPSQEMNGEE